MIPKILKTISLKKMKHVLGNLKISGFAFCTFICILVSYPSINSILFDVQLFGSHLQCTKKWIDGIPEPDLKLYYIILSKRYGLFNIQSEISFQIGQVFPVGLISRKPAFLILSIINCIKSCF